MLVVGLGNPGKKYTFTRHNVGFLALDRMAQSLGIDVGTIKFQGLYGEEMYRGEKIRLLKPETYMNESGRSVRECASYFKIPPEEILVLTDDIDIPFGTIRIKRSGSAGTHNGLKSVIYQLQSDQFPRIKIAVGQKHPNQDLASFVLSGFPKEDGPTIEKALDRARDAALCILDEGIDQAMNQFNGN